MPRATRSRAKKSDENATGYERGWEDERGRPVAPPAKKERKLSVASQVKKALKDKRAAKHDHKERQLAAAEPAVAAKREDEKAYNLRARQALAEITRTLIETSINDGSLGKLYRDMGMAPVKDKEGNMKPPNFMKVQAFVRNNPMTQDQAAAIATKPLTPWGKIQAKNCTDADKYKSGRYAFASDEVKAKKEKMGGSPPVNPHRCRAGDEIVHAGVRYKLVESSRTMPVKRWEKMGGGSLPRPSSDIGGSSIQTTDLDAD